MRPPHRAMGIPVGSQDKAGSWGWATEVPQSSRTEGTKASWQSPRGEQEAPVGSCCLSSEAVEGTSGLVRGSGGQLGADRVEQRTNSGGQDHRAGSRARLHSPQQGALVLTEAWLSLSRGFSLGGRTNPVGRRPVGDTSIPERRIHRKEHHLPATSVSKKEHQVSVSQPYSALEMLFTRGLLHCE